MSKKAEVMELWKDFMKSVQFHIGNLQQELYNTADALEALLDEWEEESDE